MKDGMKRMIWKATCLMLCLMLCPLSALKGTALADGAVAEIGGTKYSDLNTAISAWDAGETLKLLADITTTSSITITGGTTDSPKVLDLNGYGILYTGTSQSSVLKFGNSSTPCVLELTDSGPTRKHNLPLYENGRATAVDSGSSGLQITGGYIAGGSGTPEGAVSSGGGIYVYPGSTFTMKGGNICGNIATRGGGVFLQADSGKAEFTMTGGTICGNTATMGGGGVYVASSGSDNFAAFTMSGGEISGNKAKSGGGVENRGSFTLSDGTITLNVAEGTGYNDSNVFLDDAITNTGGGGVLNVTSGSFTMSGGTISYNKAYTYGGGVSNVPYDYSTSMIDYNASNIPPVKEITINMTGGSIIGNTAANGGGVANCGYNAKLTFNMSGGEISGNTAWYPVPDPDPNSTSGVVPSSGKRNNYLSGLGGGVANLGSKHDLKYDRYTENEYWYVGRENTLTFNLSGDVRITDNRAHQGGGIACAPRPNKSEDDIHDIQSRIVLNLNGGTITNNTVYTIDEDFLDATGGGVYFSDVYRCIDFDNAQSLQDYRYEILGMAKKFPRKFYDFFDFNLFSSGSSSLPEVYGNKLKDGTDSNVYLPQSAGDCVKYDYGSSYKNKYVVTYLDKYRFNAKLWGVTP